MNALPVGQNWPGCEDGSQAGASEVYVVQYLRPDGRCRVMRAEVGEALAARVKASNLVLSAEALPSGEVAVYARRPNDPEHAERCGIAVNGPGENNPSSVLARLVFEVLEVAR